MDRNMHKPNLLILADDLTGALDSGVQLTQKGAKVIIVTNKETIASIPADTDVIVIDTETRHLDGKDAAVIIDDLVKYALSAGIQHIYKKTDSGLRGNVGAELTAVLKAGGADHLNFIPAYPSADRKTIDGVHYVNGKPLSESVFAQDPIDPVTESKIDDLIHLQSDVKVSNSTDPNPAGIVVFNAENSEDMHRIADELIEKNDFFLTAGSAGFLEVYPMNINHLKIRTNPTLSKKLIVLSGSVNEVTKAQLDMAERNGAERFHVPLDSILTGNEDISKADAFAKKILNENADAELILIDTLSACSQTNEDIPADDKASRIASWMGELAKAVSKHSEELTMMIVGGDTLRGFISTMHITQIEPIYEIDPGIVLAQYRYEDNCRYMITKSGGFGKDEQLMNTLQWLKKDGGKMRK